jgi:hypothetical protein
MLSTISALRLRTLFMGMDVLLPKLTLIIFAHRLSPLIKKRQDSDVRLRMLGGVG